MANTPISFRPDDDTNIWLRRYAAFYNLPLNQVVNRAIRALILSVPKEDLPSLSRININPAPDDDNELDEPLDMDEFIAQLETGKRKKS
jgi:hypothetical protein